MTYEAPLGYVPIFSSAPRPLGCVYSPILLSEVEQKQRPSGNGDREAIVVGAGLCNSEGERAYIAYAPHYVFAWTDTRVLFIKKPMKADYSNPSAYRPISISSHIGKFFEKILNRRLMRYMLSEKLNDIEQEGFLPKKNTVRSLFRLKLECDSRRVGQEEQIMCSSHKSRLRKGFR